VTVTFIANSPHPVCKSIRSVSIAGVAAPMQATKPSCTKLASALHVHIGIYIPGLEIALARKPNSANND